MKLLLVLSLALPMSLWAGTSEKQELSEEGAPPRMIIIRVKMNEKGEESEPTYIAVNSSKLVNDQAAAEALHRECEGREFSVLDIDNPGELTAEMDQFFKVQDLIASDPLTENTSALDQSNRWRHFNRRSGFYGHGRRGNYGYGNRYRYRHGNYGSWWRGLYYPFVYGRYSYPYRGYRNYYYHNPYYRW